MSNNDLLKRFCDNLIENAVLASEIKKYLWEAKDNKLYTFLVENIGKLDIAQTENGYCLYIIDSFNNDTEKMTSHTFEIVKRSVDLYNAMQDSGLPKSDIETVFNCYKEQN